MKFLFSGLDAGTYFTLFQERDKDIYYSFKDILLGVRQLFLIAIMKKIKPLFGEVNPVSKSGVLMRTPCIFGH